MVNAQALMSSVEAADYLVVARQEMVVQLSSMSMDDLRVRLVQEEVSNLECQQQL